MWFGDYSFVNLIGLLIQSIFIQNILLFYFLGMCSYLACSNKMATANGLGLADVAFAVNVFEVPFAEANGLGCQFDEFVTFDVFQGGFEGVCSRSLERHGSILVG